MVLKLNTEAEGIQLMFAAYFGAWHSMCLFLFYVHARPDDAYSRIVLHTRGLAFLACDLTRWSKPPQILGLGWWVQEEYGCFVHSIEDLNLELTRISS